jgi:competence protein ComEC
MNIFDKRPLFLILIVAISGFVGFTFSGGILKGILCAVALLLLILSLFLFYKKRIITNPLLIILPAVLLVSMIFSFIYFELYFKAYNHYEGEVTIEGKIISYENDSYASNIIVKTSKIDGKIRYGHTVRMSLEKYKLDERFDIGSKISFSGNISEFENFSDMDANAYYFAKGIGANVKNVRNVRYLGEGTLPISYYTESIRMSVFDRIDSLSDNNAASLFAALFTGERDLLSDQIKLDFRRLGITHILALSGLHLSIISLGLSRVLSALQIKKKPRLIIIAIFIVLYMVLTGLSVSVVRAGLMILIYTALFLLGKTKDSITSLAISVFLILLFRPFAVYDLALWLSALATFGIVAFSSEEEYTEKTTFWKALSHIY